MLNVVAVVDALFTVNLRDELFVMWPWGLIRRLVPRI